MKMCGDIRENISLYIDNELDLDSRIDFEQHISECRECNKELQEMIKIIEICKTAGDEELPDGFETELHKKLLNEKAAIDRDKVFIIRKSYFKMLTSAAAVFLLFFLMKGVLDLNFFGSLKTSESPLQSNLSASVRDESKTVLRSAAEPDIANNDVMDKANDSVEAQKFGSGFMKAEAAQTPTIDRAEKDFKSEQNAGLAGNANAYVFSESITKNQTNLEIYVNDPSANSYIIKTIALKYNAAEQKPLSLAGTFSASAALTGEKEGTEKTSVVNAETTENPEKTTIPVTAASNQIELFFKVPNDQFEAFINELSKKYGKSNIELQTITTEDMSMRLEELVKQYDAIDSRISEIGSKEDADSKKELKKLSIDKLALQDEIDAIRLDTDMTYIKLLIMKAE